MLIDVVVIIYSRLNVDDYDALSKINNLVKSDKFFEQKLLEFHLSAINEYKEILDFDSNQLSDKMRELLNTLTEMNWKQIKFLFEDVPESYSKNRKIKFLKDNNTEYDMFIELATRDDLISTIENEAKLKIDSIVESAIDMAEEVHAGVKREDNASSFLETHIWPVTINVIRYYLSVNKPLTTLQIISTILHDVMEDDEKILDLYASKSYGFDAYFTHRFGDYVYNVATTLKLKPLNNFEGATEEEQQTERFHDYCNTLLKSDYDVKVIKLADRLNNMQFIAEVPYHDKVKRYLKEAEDFYLAFGILSPKMIDFYGEIRKAYLKLKELSNKDQVLVQSTSN